MPRSNSDGADGESSPKRLVIRPLQSVGDRGIPSKSVSKDLRRVLAFIEDERHLVAYDLYQNVMPRWEAMIHEKRALDAAREKAGEKKRGWIRKGGKEFQEFDEADYKAAHELTRKHRDDFNLLLVSTGRRRFFCDRPVYVLSLINISLVMPPEKSSVIT